MSKKIDFVEKATEPGAKLAPLCREFGISRQTGNKWRQRFVARGYLGLEEESRRPKSSPLATAEDIVVAVVECRDAHPRWGPKKLLPMLQRRFGAAAPSRATVARILKRFNLVRERRQRRALSIVERAPDVSADRPNELWTVDFKGWWRTLDGERCEPLTVRDGCSRYVLAVVLTRPKVEPTKRVMDQLFRQHGLPAAIQCDNGPPFIHVRARAGFSRLSAWWVSLGIRLVRSRPACPQDNGGHERMHRDIAADIERAPAHNAAAQQRLLDRWRQEFNHVRPHEALGGQTPAERYVNSERRFHGPLVPNYPPQMVVKRVYRNGNIRLDGEPYHLSRSLAEQTIGLEPLDELRYRVWFYDVDCGELEVVPGYVERVVPQQYSRTPVRPARHDARQQAGRTRHRKPQTRNARPKGTTPFPPAEPNQPQCSL